MKVLNSLSRFALVAAVCSNSIIFSASAQEITANNAPQPLIPQVAEVKEPEDLPIVPEAGQIKIGELDEIKNVYGLGSAEQNGFDNGLWKSGSALTSTKLLQRLPLFLDSNVLNDFANRLLKNSAPAPQGNDGEEKTFIEAKLSQLQKSGHSKEALDIIGQIPPQEISPSLIQTKAESLLIEGNSEAACTEAQNALALNVSSYWQEFMVLCNIKQNEKAKAGLSISLLKDSGYQNEDFFTLSEIALGLNPTKLKYADGFFANPVLASLALDSGEVKPDLSKTPYPWLARLYANHNKTDAKEKIIATENALNLNAAQHEELSALYLSLKDKDKNENKLTPVEERAALFVQIKNQTDNLAKAKQIAEFLTKDEGLSFDLKAKIIAPLLAEIEPQAELLWLRDAALKIFLSLGQVDNARKWYALETQNIATASETFWASLFLLLEGTIPALRDEAIQTLASIKPENPEIPTLFMNIFEAMGAKISKKSWLNLALDKNAEQEICPDMALLKLLEEPEELSKGETGLIALILAQISPTNKKLNPAVVSAIIKAFMAQGFVTEAQSFAAEEIAALFPLGEIKSP